MSGLLALAPFAASCADRPASGGAEHNDTAGALSARTLRGGMEEWFTDRAHESGLDFVHFNGGNAEEWTGVPVDRYTTLKEGEGR